MVFIFTEEVRHLETVSTLTVIEHQAPLLEKQSTPPLILLQSCDLSARFVNNQHEFMLTMSGQKFIPQIIKGS